MNAALQFAPLRVHPEQIGFSVLTRKDETPGTLNNFEVAYCQHEPEANLFAAAPELLSSLKKVLAMLELLNAPGTNDPIEACVYAAKAAIARTEGTAPRLARSFKAQ